MLDRSLSWSLAVIIPKRIEPSKLALQSYFNAHVPRQTHQNTARTDHPIVVFHAITPNCCASCVVCLSGLSLSLFLSLSPYCLLMFDVSCHYTSSHIFAATANCFTTTSPLPHILSSHLRPLQVSLYEVNTRSAYIVCPCTY